jgi:hypothetical protein
VPRVAIEVLIAGSILLAAIHAIRPLFSGREWLVAAAFGTVHGLAFSESLAGLALAPSVRALAVAGFNLGVEGAQLVAMICAVPMLAASRWRIFHAMRVGTMICAALVAVLWMIERSRALPFIAFGDTSVDDRMGWRPYEMRNDGREVVVSRLSTSADASATLDDPRRRTRPAAATLPNSRVVRLGADDQRLTKFDLQKIDETLERVEPHYARCVGHEV